MVKADDDIDNELKARPALVDRSGTPLPDYLQAAFVSGTHPMKVWRRHRGLAMGELARIAGTTTETIFNMERFNEAPEDDLIDILADILEADPDTLFKPN